MASSHTDTDTTATPATGDVIIREGGKWNRLAIGSANNLLRVSGGKPDWEDLGTIINEATSKATPVDADELGLSDSAASSVLKKLTWANLKATLKTYFDTLYQAVGNYYSVGGIEVAVTDGGTGASHAANARTNLGLAIGSDVQAYDPDLDNWAAKTTPSGTVVGTTDTQTLTNKRINPREATEASNATPTPNSDTTDIHTITAQAAAATFGAPTGTPVQGQKLIIRIKDNATARALSWNAIYRASSDLALPTTTVLSKTLYCGFIYNSTDTKWDLVAVLNNI